MRWKEKYLNIYIKELNSNIAFSWITPSATPLENNKKNNIKKEKACVVLYSTWYEMYCILYTVEKSNYFQKFVK